MSFFGYDTYVYLEYGKFKGVLFGLLIFLFASSLYANRKLSIFMKLFSIVFLLLYVSRGNIIFSILIYFFLLIYENKITNKRLFFLSLFLMIFILMLFQILGEFRTGTEVFYNSLEIKEQYRIENSGLIWLISYVSMPYVNFLQITDHDMLFYGENIVSRSLPAFLSFNSEAVLFYKSIIPNEYNTVSGYLAQIYLDFGFVGIIVYNFILGILLSYMYYISNNFLMKSIFMTIISLLFFVDYLFYFTTIVLLILSFLFNKLVFKRKYKIQ
jgi:oligosaccharide repeat unit polymerase